VGVQVKLKSLESICAVPERF